MPQNICEITTLDLSYVVPVKSTMEISQNFVAFSEYMNFKISRSMGWMDLKIINDFCNYFPILIHEELQSNFSRF